MLLHTQREDFSAACGCDCLLYFTHLAFVALYQSAGSISFWLINVQFEVYYEPPGFNYYTITQSIPCHFIFMALLCLCMCTCLILFWKNFTSLAGFYTILLICPYCFYLGSLCVLSTLFFHQSDPLYILFLLFLGCIVLLPLETALQVFANSSLGGLFPGDLLHSLLTGCSVWIAWCHWPFQRPGGPALQPWTYHGQWFLSKGPIKDQGRSFFLF